MKPEPSLRDDADRERAATDFDTTFVAVAGAGTGKTSLLVERMMGAAVLAGISPAEQVAITFTKKAAAEMRDRLADGLECLRAIARGERPAEKKEKGRDDKPGEGEGRRTYRRARQRGLTDTAIAERAVAALSDCDRALVDTIHGYCVDFLRRHPREAGFDPRFRVDDGSASARLARRTWEEWIRAEMGPEGKRLALWTDLLARMPFSALAEVARAAAAAGYAGEWEAFRKAPATLDRAVRDLCADTAREARAASAAAPADAKPVKIVQKLLEVADRLEEAARDGWAGRPENFWPDLGDADPSKKLPERTRALQARAHRRAKRLLKALRETKPDVWEAALAALAPWAKLHHEAFRSNAIVTFHELLLVVRDLLLTRPDLREREKRRIRLLLVDEFQDTDPLQYEIVFLLAEREGGRAAAAWEASLRPGKLFIVGDPKQSIYRFRGADIQVFFAARARLEEQGARVLHLTENFRSVPEILNPLNALFARAFAPSPCQPPYQAIRAARKSAGDGPRIEVWRMAPPVEGRANAETFRRREGEAIAGWIARACATGTSCRSIALVFRATGDLHHYLRPLRERGIPFVVDGGKTFGEKTEIRSFLALLSALADPTDEISVLAALRSPFSGATDAELARHAARHGKGAWALAIAPDPEESPRLAKAFTALRTLSEEVRRLPAERALRRAAEASFAAELNASSYEGSQRAANLERLVDRIAHLARAEGLGFAGAVAAVRREIEEETVPEGESPLADEKTDAVRVLTIHKAKGLEYDTVIVPDLARRDGSGSHTGDRTALDRRVLPGGGAVLAARAAGRSGRIRNAADLLAHAQEDFQEEAESIRLFYVACTRARERLILVSSPGAATLWQDLLASAGEDGGILTRDMDPAAFPRRGVPAPLATERLAAAVKTFRAARRRAQAAAGRWALSPSESSGAEESLPFPERAGPRAPDAGRLGAATGTAIHRILEQWDRKTPDTLAQHVETAARLAAERTGVRVEAVREEVAEILGALRQGDLLDQLARLDIVGREMPVEATVGGKFTHGFIDLLYKRGDAVVVADFKTDRIAPAGEAALLARHAPQLSAYARAVQAALGLPAPPPWEIWALRAGKILRP